MEAVKCLNPQEMKIKPTWLSDNQLYAEVVNDYILIGCAIAPLT